MALKNCLVTFDTFIGYHCINILSLVKRIHRCKIILMAKSIVIKILITILR